VVVEAEQRKYLVDGLYMGLRRGLAVGVSPPRRCR
jgi:hypothetical protein